MGHFLRTNNACSRVGGAAWQSCILIPIHFSVPMPEDAHSKGRKKRMAIQLCTALHKILRTVKRPGDFCTSGRMAVHLPVLEVEGVGRIALPLLETQARQLIDAAEAAPYGRGSETLHDPDYRRTWQIDAGRIRLRGVAWEKDLEAIVRRAAEGLGVEGPVAAQPYKLLIYEPGCFFLPHRDTEKAAGMFATLVVLLPSDFSGGELVVEHQGRQVTLDLHQDDPAEVSYAAFYADCRHEVKPVRAGYRLALIFNLVRPQAKRLPKPPTHEPVIVRLAETLRGWNDDIPAG
ncbi:MAG TPA: 2OG-Fe(II) oxygenase [Methylothermaceae bacterium]|nr:2OG-Fe(II) oxygenase [Methylothermaceae bacterium]